MDDAILIYYNFLLTDISAAILISGESLKIRLKLEIDEISDNGSNGGKWHARHATVPIQLVKRGAGGMEG